MSSFQIFSTAVDFLYCSRFSLHSDTFSSLSCQHQVTLDENFNPELVATVATILMKLNTLHFNKIVIVVAMAMKLNSEFEIEVENMRVYITLIIKFFFEYFYKPMIFFELI